MDPSTQCLIIIYIGYWSLVDSLQLDVESTSKLDSEGVNTLMGPSGPRFKLIYLISMGCEGWISSKFTFVHEGVLIIMQGCTRVSERGLQIRLID